MFLGPSRPSSAGCLLLLQRFSGVATCKTQSQCVVTVESSSLLHRGRFVDLIVARDDTLMG